jgi:hypothetical protein
MKRVVALTLLLLAGCNDSSRFASGTQVAASQPKPVSEAAASAEKVPAVAPAATVVATAAPVRVPDAEKVPAVAPAATVVATAAPVRVPDAETVAKLQQECWFAVSGTWAGYPSDYETTFPQTKSGKPIGPGEVFDTVGGVYLAARAEPYVYGEGGKEIDKAVDFTFDSILIAPGMTAEIRDGQGNRLFDGVGPLIGESAYYANNSTWAGVYLTKLLSRKETLPVWMQDWLAVNNKLVVIDLYAARWVKVSSVPGSKCAW